MHQQSILQLKVLVVEQAETRFEEEPQILEFYQDIDIVAEKKVVNQQAEAVKKITKVRIQCLAE